MGKQTDYKRLWKNAKTEATQNHNKYEQMKRVAESRGELLQDIRDGVVDPKKILSKSKVETGNDLKKVLQTGIARSKNKMVKESKVVSKTFRAKQEQRQKII